MIPCYLDKNGNAIKPGMKILMADGSVELVYETTDEFGNQDLGISATNKAFLDRHPDWEQEFYSLSSLDTRSAEICLSEPEIRKELDRELRRILKDHPNLPMTRNNRIKVFFFRMGLPVFLAFVSVYYRIKGTQR